jgi:hypothetical protein
MNKTIYFERTNKESHINIFRSLEIENYFKQSLKKQGFNLHDHSLSFSGTKIKIFLSIYDKTQSQKKKRCASAITKLIVGKKLWEQPNQMSKQNFETHKENLRRQTQANFWKNSLKGLNKLTENQFQITLRIKWVSKKFLEKNAKKSISDLRYKFRIFEMKRLYLALSTQKNTAGLLSIFISEYLRTTKRHNFFFNSLIQGLTLIIKQKHSKMKGLKILLKGRLNNAPRSRNKTIKIGKIPLITQNVDLNYAESVSFTPNGTIGIKIWINQ